MIEDWQGRGLVQLEQSLCWPHARQIRPQFLRYSVQTGLRMPARWCGLPRGPVFPTGVELARQALLVTFDEKVDSQLVRAALENLLRKRALRWVGLDGNNVQVWRTADICQGTSQQRGTE